MAAVAETQTVTVTINDVELVVPKGELVIESAKRLGIDIPIFCYHPRLKPVGMCRMCLVEVGTKQPDGTVRMMPKPQASCTLPASEGLIIKTDTESIHKDRKGVLEFLLINHPLDCPICDRGGECPLQNNTLFYGPSTTRFLELKRHAHKAFPLSNYVTLDLERCIQCGRCVRFTEEISGDGQLALRFRGAKTQPGTFGLDYFDSKFSGNTIEICPVGALTSSKYRFRARPWDLETHEAICTLCSNGCNVTLDSRIGKFVRILGRTNEAVNEDWTCDRGKFGHENYNSEARATQSMVRSGSRLEATTMSDALSKVLSEFNGKGASAAVLAGAELGLEDYIQLKKFAQDLVGTDRVSSTWNFDPLPIPTSLKPLPIQTLETAGCIFVFGSSLAEDLPIIYLRVRKAWFKYGVPVYSANSAESETDSFANGVYHYRPGSELAFLKALNGSVQAKEFESETGLSYESLSNLKAALEAAGTRVVASDNLMKLPEAAQILEELAQLGQKASVSVYRTGGNAEGAQLAGFGCGTSAESILRDCASGKISHLCLAGANPFELVGDRALVEKALETVESLVVLGSEVQECAGYATVFLPTTKPAETTSVYINCEGRAQLFKQALPSLGDAKPVWKIATELLLRGNKGSLLDREEVLATVPGLSDRLSGLEISGEGVLLS